jgi:hypothetical protein
MIILHFLHALLGAFVVSLLETHDFGRSLFGLFNFLPCLGLLLAQQGDAVCQELRISLDPKMEN